MLEWIIQFSSHWSSIYQCDDQSRGSGGPVLSTPEDHMHQWIVYNGQTHLGLSACVCPYIIPDEWSKCRSPQVQHDKDSSANKQTILQPLPCGVFPSQYPAIWQPVLVFNMMISLRLTRSTTECQYKCTCKLRFALASRVSGFIRQHVLMPARRRPLTDAPPVLLYREKSLLHRLFIRFETLGIRLSPVVGCFQHLISNVRSPWSRLEKTQPRPSFQTKEDTTQGSRKSFNSSEMIQLNVHLHMLFFYLCCFELFSQWWQKFLVGKMEVAAVVFLPLPLPLQHSPGRLPSHSCGFAS